MIRRRPVARVAVATAVVAGGAPVVATAVVAGAAVRAVTPGVGRPGRRI